MADLDARIRWWITDGSDCEDPATGWDKATAALLAVLDKHKANPAPYGPYCEVCAGGYEGVSEWPCETVRGIAEKLGVQAS